MTAKKLINLIPREAPKKAAAGGAPGFLARYKILGNIILLLIGPVAYAVWQAIEINTLQEQLKLTQGKLKGAKTNLNQTQSQSVQMEKEKADLTKELDGRKLRLQQLLSTTPAGKNYAKMLEELVGFMPKDLWLGQAVLGDEQLQLTGSAMSPELIVQLTNQMDKSGAFKGSVFTSSERQLVESRTVYNFKITAEPVWAALGGKKGDVSIFPAREASKK